jgi:metallo-beta-lactamase family protein
LQWLQTMPGKLEQVYVAHGEMSAADTLRCRIERELGIQTKLPEHGGTRPY